MHKLRVAARSTLAAGVIVFAACADNTNVTAPEADLSLTQQPTDLAAISRQLPGFGGMFLDHGVPTVYLANPATLPMAERVLGSWKREHAGDVPLQVRQGDFTYAQLDRWFNSATMEVLALDNAVFVDLDESTNRVLIGYERGSDVGRIRAAAMKAGVPANAIVMRETDPIRQMATLQDQVRPVQGGLQIHWDQYVCTIGFNAIAGGQSSFITNSHCSGQQGGVQNTQYDQAVRGTPGSFIGTEVADPTYFRNGTCPKGKKCRRSDSSRAAYAAGVSTALGVIARTTGANNGSLTINGSFNITAENTSLTFTVGSTANKIGRTTGWTAGPITNTCVNTGVQGSNIMQLCQTFVQAGVGGGDSGSPVFAVTGSSSVTLLGILWGGSGNTFVFSPLGAVEAELGALTTF